MVFAGDSVAKNSPASAGDEGSIAGSGRSPATGNGDTLQYSCLGNSMDRGDWRATVHRVAQSQARLKQLSTHSQAEIKVPTRPPSIQQRRWERLCFLPPAYSCGSQQSMSYGHITPSSIFRKMSY